MLIAEDGDGDPFPEFPELDPVCVEAGVEATGIPLVETTEAAGDGTVTPELSKVDVEGGADADACALPCGTTTEPLGEEVPCEGTATVLVA